MKGTTVTGEFDAVVTEISPDMWVARVESAVYRVPVSGNPNYAPARGIVNAVLLSGLLWLFLGFAAWYLV